MTRSSDGLRLLALGALALLAACAGERPVAPTRPEAPASLGLAVGPAPGGPRRVAVRLTLRDPARAVGGVQGELTLSAPGARYVGQVVQPDAYAVTPDSVADGEPLRFGVLAVGPLPADVATFVFDLPVGTGPVTATLRLRRSATPRGLELALPAPAPATEAPGTLEERPVRRMTLADWTRLLEPGRPAAGRQPAYVAGAGLIFGDANLDGTISLLDALAAVNVSVGNLSLIADPAFDNVIAANVVPANLPGLGEALDPSPPGREPNGTFVVDLLDALAIVNYAVGNFVDVVGNPIPGRTSTGVRGVLSGTLIADRLLSRDTTYELSGVVSVPNGVTLTIQAGTRIEGSTATGGRLAVLGGGRIIALGTRIQPIVFTCTAAVKYPGCWGGVNINGFAGLNNDGGTTGNLVEPCPKKVAPGNLGYYGGCLDADSSGALRYVRIEYAGGQAANGVLTAGLALLGVGSATKLDTIQVLRSGSDGVFISGGRASPRALLVNGSFGAGLRWNDGWQGQAQNIVVQQPTGGGPAVWGRNADLIPGARRLTYPVIYNLTAIGAPAGMGTVPAVLLESGTGGFISNAVIQRAGGPGLEINGAESCALTADSLVVQRTLFADGNPDFSNDADCVDEAAYALAPARANLQVAPGLAAPFLTLTPDFRPRPGSAAALAIPPPGSGFFDPAENWYGGTPVESNVVPWFTGWTTGY